MDLESTRKKRFDFTRARYANNDSRNITIAIVLISGTLALLFSILYEIPTLAFIGLGLTFWGVLFLLIGPARQTESNLLYNAAIPSYSTIDRIMKDFNCTSEAFYIPAYPKGIYIPEHLKSLREAIVYVSGEENSDLPSNEEIAQTKFLLENPKGILITPPGLGILNHIENESNIDFANVSVNQFCEIMPQIIVDNFNLATEIEMTLKEKEITMKIKDSVYKRLYERALYGEEANLKSVLLLGCPLVSAIVCALTKSSTKIVRMTKYEISPNDLTIKVTCQFVKDWSYQIHSS